jgi:hypothetical protein
LGAEVGVVLVATAQLMVGEEVHRHYLLLLRADVLLLKVMLLRSSSYSIPC